MNPVLLLLLLLLPLSVAAQDVATLTLRDGGLRVIRGTTVLQSAEGMRLHRGDVLESSDSGFAQLEFAGGGIVALGPSTGMYLLSHNGGATELVVLSGWVKAQTPAGTGSFRFLTPLAAAATRDGTLVLHVTPAVAEMYVESGTATIGESRDSSNGKTGQFFSRRAGKNISRTAQMPASFIQSMPVPFRDTLPSRLPKFAGKPVEPRRDHEVTYAEIHPWLTMAPAWRKGFVHRFEPRLNDAAFRKSVEAHLNEHPEWDPILHPEKYQRKPPITASDTANGRAGR
jgi:hypothetical protein